MTIDEMRAAIREARGLDQLRDSADPVERVSFLLDLEGEADAMLPVLDMIARLRSIEEAARAVAEQAQQDDCELCLAHRGHHYPDCTVPALACVYSMSPGLIRLATSVARSAAADAACSV